jgi:hypothetical protein
LAHSTASARSPSARAASIDSSNTSSGVGPSASAFAIESSVRQPDLIAEHVDPKAATRFVDVDPAEANMLDFQIGRTPTEEEAQSLDKALSSVQGMDYALVPTPKGWRVLNTGNMPNDQFGSTVHQAIENLESTSLPDTIEATRSHYVGDYISNDWSKSPNAENYLQTIGQAGPDVQRSADTLRASFWSQVEFVTERYGWQRRDESTSKGGAAQAGDLTHPSGGRLPCCRSSPIEFEADRVPWDTLRQTE